MFSTIPEADLMTSPRIPGQLTDSGQHQQHQHQQQVVAVRSVSTILPYVDCGVVPHRGTEAGQRMLVIHSKDLQSAPCVEIMVQLIDGQLRPSSATSCSSSTWRPHLPSASIAQTWMTFIRPARDRHEQNMELVRDPLGRLCLKTVRLVRPGEELLLWYSEEVARNFGVPIISPANITRDEEYVCTACKSCFRFPNTLKSHILFDCRLPFTNLLLSRCRPSTPFCFSPWSTSIHSTDLTPTPLASGFPLVLGHACAVLDRRRCFGDEVLTRESALPVPVMTSSASGQFLTSDGTGKELVTCPGSRRLFQATYGGKRLPLLQRMFADVSSGLNAPADWPALMTSADDCPIKPNRINRMFAEELSLEASCVDSRSKFTELPDGQEVKDGKTGKEKTARKRIRHHCKFCGKLYSRKYGLTIHLRTHSGYKPLKCKVCLRPFGDPSNLNKHVRLHGDGDTPYRCRHCGKVLVRRRDLDRHIRSRHPDVSEGEENVANVSTGSGAI